MFVREEINVDMQSILKKLLRI